MIRTLLPLVLTKAILTTAATASDEGWLAVQRDNFVTHNLESTPLEIKTDRALGSEDEIMLTFETASGNSEAGFKITFPARYNNKRWEEYWRNIRKLAFHHDDSLSVQYRPYIDNRMNAQAITPKSLELLPEGSYVHGGKDLNTLIDGNITTGATFANPFGYRFLIRFNLDKVYCIYKVINYIPPTPWSPLTIWNFTCSSASCNCDYMDKCPFVRPLTVTFSGAIPDNLPERTDCMYGDTVTLEDRGIIRHDEIVITGFIPEYEDPHPNCVDKNKWCSRWASDGFCHLAYLIVNCVKSCNLCA